MKKTDSEKSNRLKHVGTPLLLSTGVMMAADMPMQAEGTIQYYGLQATLSSGHTNTLLNQVGGIQFILGYTTNTTTGNSLRKYNAYVNMTSVFFQNGNGNARNFASGETIGGSDSLGAWNQNQNLFSFQATTGATGIWNPSNANHNFNGTDANVGYIGFKSGANYGWVRVEVPAWGSSYKLNGWAIEDSGVSIKAGDQGGGGSAAPEPSGLALLACGAAGIYALRRKCKNTKDEG